MLRATRTPEEEAVARDVFDKAHDKVVEYFNSIKRSVQLKQGELKRLQDDIELLIKRQKEIDAELKFKEEASANEIKAKSDEIRANAEAEAKRNIEQLVSDGRRTVDELDLRKKQLTSEIDKLITSFNASSKQMKESISILTEQESELKSQVAKLTNTKDELFRQISAIKERISFVA